MSSVFIAIFALVIFTLVILLKLLYDYKKSHEGMIDIDEELVSAPMSAPMYAHMSAPMSAPMYAHMSAPMSAHMYAHMSAPMSAHMSAPMYAHMSANETSNNDNMPSSTVTNFKPTIDKDSKPYTEQRIDMSNVKQPPFPIKYDSIGKYNRLFELSNKNEKFEIPRV